MNKKQIEAYIKDPNHCPFCNSEDIKAGDYDFDGRQGWIEVSCNFCGKKWRDIYQLKEVEEIQ
jgi:hypothetical protein